jgi:BMFP domain-containing protein YqiC
VLLHIAGVAPVGQLCDVDQQACSHLTVVRQHNYEIVLFEVVAKARQQAAELQDKKSKLTERLGAL